MIEFILIALAPILGGLIYGFERVIKARMQNRIGPPFLQPFYDMLKLCDKESFMVNSYHIIFAIMHFVTLWVTIAMFILGFNLLYIIFIHLLSTLFLVIAGFSVNSSYSQLGSNRELITLIAYEPILILVAIGFYLITGSFDTSLIFASNSSLGSLFLIFLAFLLIVPVKLKKSPFDASEAHQEIVGGVEVEYSGIFYEIIYTAKWLEYIFVYLFIFLFAGDSVFLGIVLSVFVFFLINLVDNSTARVRVDSLVKIVLFLGLSLCLVNIAGVLYV